MKLPPTSRSLKQKIYDDIAAIVPFDEEEKLHIEDAKAWISSGAPLFRIKKDPDIPRKHLVAYLVLVDPEHKSILLVDHIKAQRWLPTGGHILPGETPTDAVIREAKEELAIKAVFLKNNAKPFFLTVVETIGLTPGYTDVSMWYLLRGNKHDFINFNHDEFTDIEWFTFDEVAEFDSVVLGQHLQRFTKKLANYITT